MLGEIGISHGRLVMPTRDNCVQLESLLEAATALVETKKVVDKVEQDIRVLKARLGKRESEGAEDSFGTGEAAPTPMDVDEVEAEADGRAQSVVSTRSARSVRSRKQVSSTRLPFENCVFIGPYLRSPDGPCLSHR